jgi:adenylyltransferase/sulfurtransferase
MVNEAVKLLTGIGDPLLGRLLAFDALDMTWREVRVRKDPTGTPVTALIDYDAFCGVASQEASEAVRGSTISVRELKDMLDARERGEKDFLLVDVREPDEFDIVSIPGAVLIPKGEFLSGAALERLPADRPVVLHCKAGTRSAEALAVVKGAGYADAVHVGGGVLAWVDQIEPDKPSY